MSSITTPVKPPDLFLSLIHLDFSKDQCIEEQNSRTSNVIMRKELLKKQIQTLMKNKLEFLQLFERKKQLKQNLTQLLNYRQSIDYDHKYKTLKFDHYQFPYRSNYKIKQEVNNLRLQNRQKRKKINELTKEIKAKQKFIQKKAVQSQHFFISQIAHIPTKKDILQREDRFWLNKIDSIKVRHLNNEQEYKRAKIRHDYNLFVEKSGCVCIGMKVCPLCSDLNLQTRRNTYTQQALLSPRYTKIYR